jgi:hypothetical protein
VCCNSTPRNSTDGVRRVPQHRCAFAELLETPEQVHVAGTGKTLIEKRLCCRQDHRTVNVVCFCR